MADKYEIIRDYVRELGTGQSYISTSHYTLRSLQSVHGHQYIDKLLSEYWEEFGPDGGRDAKLTEKLVPPPTDNPLNVAGYSGDLVPKPFW